MLTVKFMTLGGNMKILVTNDDGIHSEGLRLLALELQKNNDVYVVAPDRERSATSHGITLRNPMDLKKVRLEGIINDAYTLSGTPADCVRVGLELLYKDIDIVFSGINRGYNAGADVQYSGTVGACAEANIYKTPGVAISTEFADGNSQFELPSKFAPILFERYKSLLLKNIIVLNINVPKLDETDIKGVAVCELGDIIYDSFKLEEISEDHHVIHLKERFAKYIKPDSDQEYLSNGYITITPMEYGFGDSELLEKFKKVK